MTKRKHEDTSVKLDMPFAEAIRRLSTRKGSQAAESGSTKSPAALVDGRVTLASFSDGAVQRPAVRELMAKVRAGEGAEAAAFPIGGYAEVRILLRDGSEHALRVDTPRGDPSRPLSWDELVAKFRDCTAAVLSPETAELVVGLIARLEELPDVNGLTETLTGAATEARP